MILTSEVKDPRVSGAVITDVKLSDDMKHARILFVPLSEDMDEKNIEEGLKSSAGFIRKKLAKKLRLKRIPVLDFEFDEFLRDSKKLDDIIKGL